MSTATSAATDVKKPGADALLSAEEIRSSYGARRVLEGVSLNVRPGEVVTVLGHNGAGKTTLLRAIFGDQPRGGAVVFDGQRLPVGDPTAVVRAGISFTPATTPIFRQLTVTENLELGGITRRSRSERKEQLLAVRELFPLLVERRDQIAGTLSGGQQRVVSLGMALMAKPRLMLLDEPSLGIAPSLVQQIFGQIRTFSQNQGLAVLLVEQNVRASLRISDRVYYLRHGKIILEESAAAAQSREHWWDLF
jgi:branched-chain amino acid transport system ATP-binding protein